MLVHSELPEKPEKLRLWTIIQQVGWRIASTCGRVRLNNIKQAKNIVWSLSWWSSWDLFRISWGSCTTARVLVCWDFSVPGEECTRFLSKVKKKRSKHLNTRKDKRKSIVDSLRTIYWKKKKFWNPVFT